MRNNFFFFTIQIMKKAVYSSLDKNLQRRHTMERLHLYDEEEVPKEILENVSSQIEQLRIVPRKLRSYSEKEIEEFPKLANYSTDYVRK